MTTQQKCPICEGHGIVSGGFYITCPGSYNNSSSSSGEICRNCIGTGVVYVEQKDSMNE